MLSGDAHSNLDGAGGDFWDPPCREPRSVARGWSSGRYLAATKAVRGGYE